jgi:hypothetical protein
LLAEADLILRILGRQETLAKAIIHRVNAWEKFKLRLHSDVQGPEVPLSEPRNLVLVKHLRGALHFEVFDADGNVVVDTDESHLPHQIEAVKALRRQLDPLWGLSRSPVGGELHEQQIIAAVMSIVGHTLLDPSQERFGPLTVGLQTQGAIVVAYLNRQHLRLCKASVADLRRDCDHWYRESSRQLFDDPHAKPCFHFRDHEIRPTKAGLPDEKKDTLKKWLESTIADIPSSFAGMPSTFDIPLEPPRTGNDDVSTISDFWKHLVSIHPSLRAWSRLWTAATTRKALDNVAGASVPSLKVRYELFPRLMSMRPDLGELRRLIRNTIESRERSETAEGPPLFEPEPGRVFLVGCFPALALRCYAKTCLSREWVAGLVKSLRTDPDPILSMTRKLYALTQAAKKWYAEKLVDYDAAYAAACTAFDPGGELPATAVARWKTSIRVLVDAALRGFNVYHARKILWHEHGINMTDAEAEALFMRIVTGESGVGFEMVEDETLEIIEKNLNLDPVSEELPSEITYHRNVFHDHENLGAPWPVFRMSAMLRNLVRGTTKKYRQTLAKLAEVSRNPALKQRFGNRAREPGAIPGDPGR